MIARPLLTLLCVITLVSIASGDDKPRVPKSLHKAIDQYLTAKPRKEKSALKKVIRAVDKDLALAAHALRTLPPLTKSKPGTHHDRKFVSRGQEWSYSIYLPKRYNGKRKFPVLVLPDHVLIDAESGIRFWRDKLNAEDYILFRPIINLHKKDRDRFPRTQFFDIDQDIAETMASALTHLRLHYAVDPERLSLTGLSQAGYYTWYHAVSFPDQFAAIVPESAGGPALHAAILPLVRNLKAMQVRILHTEGDKTVPFEDSVAMDKALRALEASVEFIRYTDEDYIGEPYEDLHPGPAHLRLRHVLPWAHEHQRGHGEQIDRVLRYSQQGYEGRFRVRGKWSVGKPIEVTAKLHDDGSLEAKGKGISFLVSPEEILEEKTFQVRGKAVTPKPDLDLLFTSFKALGDRGRLFAAEIKLTR